MGPLVRYIIEECVNVRILQEGYSMGTFLDDKGQPIETVTAEQHAIDNIGHMLKVYVAYTGINSSHEVLRLVCSDCDWFDDKLLDEQGNA